MLETSGSVSIERVPDGVIKIMDLKCPSSGEVAKNIYDNIRFLKPVDEVKFVILDRADYEWSRDIIHQHKLDQICSVLISPVYGKLNLESLAQWILEDKLNVRMQTQLHKLIWGKDAIGV